MANIYVGFHDDRSSSRVLKPPGGGTSDIFGTDALKQEEKKSAPSTPTKDNVEAKQGNENEKKSDNTDSNSSNNTNNINGGNQGGETPSEQPNIANLSIAEENGEKTQNSQSETKPDTIGSIIRQDDRVQSPSKGAVAEPGEKKTPQRVPPGGYSSGLW